MQSVQGPSVIDYRLVDQSATQCFFFLYQCLHMQAPTPCPWSYVQGNARLQLPRGKPQVGRTHCPGSASPQCPSRGASASAQPWGALANGALAEVKCSTGAGEET
ncbi:hypothetical protein KIL84_012324 [Mauremys mutica]|uniref:Uncharacterized protein n=1 Tax=Mauremys mutica TaxID=74926 RepID=A0A9D3XFC2_9SAUR|nr:hypothetical protein KIL84_012324 [Mauremys mutica]